MLLFLFSAIIGSMWKKIWEILSALVVLGIVFGWGLYAGIQLPAESKIVGVLNKETPAGIQEEVDFTSFWQAWSVLEQKYVDIENVARQDMFYGALSGLLKSLDDPYSVFLPPDDLEELQIEISGRFEGVGMEISIRKNVLIVVAPLKGTPAEKAGVKAGDKILEVDGEPTLNLTLKEAVHKIRGPRGTEVVLTVLRNSEDETRKISVTRGIINIPVLDAEPSTDGIAQAGEGETQEPEKSEVFVISLYNFSETSTIKFREALRKMLEGGYAKLILDLRNNPGGFLNSAVDIASWFLPQGEIVVREDFGKGADKNLYRSKGYNIFNDLSMIILINRGSASASEILAGALQDHGIATLVGGKTFGKGSVQEIIPLTTDTSLKLTIAKWLTPNGVDISKEGLTPDIEVEVTTEDEEADRDPVMEKALELLRGTN